MLRTFALATGLVVLIHPSFADENIAPETVDAVKKASVFIRVEGDGWGASGSGFVVASNDKGVLVATNHHVAAPTPPVLRPAGKPTTITVVFDSGTKAERSYTATIAASDSDRDLAVLRVADVKDVPKPIAYSESPKLVETMQVYTFGYPFGKALSPGKGFPAITVGKASISSLRNNDDGELEFVQIDGNLNPGNSGGPVVDAKGRLVGVAVATVRDGQGIGLTIPSAELGKMMQGRLGRVKLTSQKKADGPVTVRIEADLIDPAENLRTAVAHYFVVAPKTKRPDGAAIDKLPGSKKIDLKIEKGVAVGEFTVPAAEGEVLVQVIADATGKPVASRLRAHLLAPLADFAGPVPAGWKEYTPRDKTFTMWLPEKPTKQADEERNFTVSGQRMRVNSVVGKTSDGLAYDAASILLPPTFAKVARKELYDSFRGAIVSEMKGRVTDSIEATSGTLTGAEYVIDGTGGTARVRMYIVGARVYVVQVIGTADRVKDQDAEMLLSSFRLPGADIAKGPNEIPVPKGKDPVIIAGGSPVFKDVAPNGGVLIGLELGLGKFGKEDVIKAVRPIYRVGEKEELGTQRGTELSRVTTIKAKEGYAVAAITCKSGLNFDGCSLTFMKLVDGKLDPKDTYESAWVGYVGIKRATKIGGDGTLVVGIAGRAGEKDLNGLGLLFKGQEGFDPNPPQAIGRVPTILGGGQDKAFKEMVPEGAMLVGFEFGLVKFFDKEVIRSAQPIYRNGDKETFGEQRGTDLSTVVTLKSKAGYAVGAVTVKPGFGFDGCSVTFMKVTDGKLDPKDAYESEWIGINESRVPTKLGDGTAIVGIVGRTTDKDMTGLGLLFKGQEAFNPNPPVPLPKEPTILGGFSNKTFKETVPDGGVLIGFEFGLINPFGRDVIRAARPIYRVGEKEVLGEQRGTDLKKVVTVKAKPGYAIGAITAKHGLALEGCSFTFMKVVDGKLDPKDAYESDWAGTDENRGTTKIGDGTMVIGVVGRVNEKEMIAMGLLFKGQEAFNPKK